MEYIAVTALFIVFVPLLLFMILKPVIADKKVRKNVTNSDPLTQHYCFALNCNQPEALDKLSTRNVNDTLEYTFDSNRLAIVFSQFDVSMEYQLAFYAVDDKTYLKVSRVKFAHGRSNIPFMINRFFVDKIGAVPVDYAYFESSILTSCYKERQKKSFEEITRWSES